MNGASGQRGGQSGSAGRQQQISDLRATCSAGASRQREIAKDMENLTRRGVKTRRMKTRRRRANSCGTKGHAGRHRQQFAAGHRTVGAFNERRQPGPAACRATTEGRADSLARDRVADRIREGKQSLNASSSKASSRVSRALVATTSARSSAVSTTFPNVCKRRNRARGANGSTAEENPIARDNWRIILIHCAGVWMRDRRGATGSKEAKSGGRGKNRAGPRSTRTAAGQQGRQVRPAGTSRDNQDSKVLKSGLVSVASGQASQNGSQSQGNRDRGGVDRSGTMGGDWGDSRQPPRSAND